MTISPSTKLPIRSEPVPWGQHRLIFACIAAVGFVDLIWLRWSDLELLMPPVYDQIWILLVPLTLGLLVARSGQWPRTTVMFLTFAEKLLIFLATTILSYLVIRNSQPLVDANLAACDQMLGLDWPAYQRFVTSHSWIAFVTRKLYETPQYQCMFLAILLGVSGRLTDLAEFVAGLFLTGLIAATIGGLLPALGAYNYFGIADHGVAHYVPTILAAHSGAFRLLDVDHVEGLIVFPSFHTAITVMLIIGSWRAFFYRYVFLPLNLVLIAGVPVWGGHYFVDIISGTLMTILVVIGWRYLFRKSWTHSSATQHP